MISDPETAVLKGGLGPEILEDKAGEELIITEFEPR